MRKSYVVTIKPIAVGFQEGRRIGGWGNTFFWGLLKSRKIESYLDGNRRKVVVASAEAYIAKKLAETTAEQIAEVSHASELWAGPLWRRNELPRMLRRRRPQRCLDCRLRGRRSAAVVPSPGR